MDNNSIEVKRHEQPDDKMKAALLLLPAFIAHGERGTMHVWTDGLLQYDKLQLANTPQNRVVVKIVAAAKPKLPPTEIATLLRFEGATMPYSTEAVYELPYGTLFNTVMRIIQDKQEDKSFWRLNIEENMELGKLEMLVDDMVERETNTADADALMPFFELAYAPQIFLEKKESSYSDKFPYDYLIESLSDVLFYTCRFANSVYRHGATIKRCKTNGCGKVFFAPHGNQKYCYFSNPDAQLHGLTCKEAQLRRTTREASKMNTWEKQVHRARNKFAFRKDDSKKQFEKALKTKKKALESDLWMYTKLIDWLHDYEEAEYSKHENRTSK